MPIMDGELEDFINQEHFEHYNEYTELENAVTNENMEPFDDQNNNVFESESKTLDQEDGPITTVVILDIPVSQKLLV